MINISLDLNGGDRPASELVMGAVAAVNEISDLFVYACGDKRELDKALETACYDRSRLVIVDAPSVVRNDEDVFSAVRSKPDSSLVRGMGLCADKKAEAFVTCGATGGIVVCAVLKLKKTDKRPTLLCELKKTDGAPFCIVDCGANIDIAPDRAVRFAEIGCEYMRAVGIKKPRVALLSIGAESKKGNGFVKEASALLRTSCDGFIGNIEGGDALTGSADVIVCDGFSGNILLKSIEGAAKAALDRVNALVSSLPSVSVNGEFKNGLDGIYRDFDYTGMGGAILIGFDVPIVKGHGAANAVTVKNIVKKTYTLAQNHLIEKITGDGATGRITA